MAPLARLCLIGPESTGKSELARRLAARFSAVCVEEFAREYVLREARELTAEDVEPIARGQLANQTACDSSLAILDTDLLSTVVYARHYYGRCPEWIEREAAERMADHYLLLDVDVPFVPDAARDASHDRSEMLAKFRAALDEFGASYDVIGGGWEERERRAVEAIARYAARS